MVDSGYSSLTGAGDTSINATDTQGMANVASDNTRVENDTYVVIVDVVILVLTCIGALSILASMAYNEYVKKRAAPVRMRLVQGLVVADLALGFTALVPTAARLAGNTFEHGSGACDGFGLLFVAAIWSEHMWTFTLAFATFLILIYPLSPMTRRLDRHWVWLYVLIWTLCTGIAVMSFEVHGFYPTGGLCYYGSNTGLFSELMQFIPRGAVFLSVCFFYSRLYGFLNRPDRIKGSFSGSGGGGTAAAGSPIGSVDSTNGQIEISDTKQIGFGRGGASHSRKKITEAFRSFSFNPRKESSDHVFKEKGGGDTKVTFAEPSALKTNRDSDSDSAEVRIPPSVALGKPSSKMVNGSISQSMTEKDHASLDSGRQYNTTPVGASVNTSLHNPTIPAAIPPWERLELPAFQIAGQRYGGVGTHSSISNKLFSKWQSLPSRRRERDSRRVSIGSTIKSEGVVPYPAEDSVAVGSPMSTLATGSGIKGREQRRRTRSERSTQNFIAERYAPRNETLRSRDGISPSRLNEMATVDDPLEGPVLAPPITVLPAMATAAIENTAIFRNPRRHPGGLNLPTLTHANFVSPYPSPGSAPSMAYSNSMASYPLPDLSLSASTASTGTSTMLPSVIVSLKRESQEPHIRRESAGSLYAESTDSRRGSAQGSVTFASPIIKTGSVSGIRRGSNLGTDSSPRISYDLDSAQRESGRRSMTRAVGEMDIDMEGGRRIGQGNENNEEEEEEDEDEELNFADMLRESYRDADGQEERRTSGSTDWQQESTASYLNRKTAMLMLYFPLAYVLLFSVSLLRLIWDFCSSTEPEALVAIARWFIFAQGIVDALIYGFVEWHTKRLVRRKIRKGTLSPRHSGAGIVSGLRRSTQADIGTSSLSRHA